MGDDGDAAVDEDGNNGLASGWKAFSECSLGFGGCGHSLRIQVDCA